MEGWGHLAACVNCGRINFDCIYDIIRLDRRDTTSQEEWEKSKLGGNGE